MGLFFGPGVGIFSRNRVFFFGPGSAIDDLTTLAAKWSKFIRFVVATGLSAAWAANDKILYFAICFIHLENHKKQLNLYLQITKDLKKCHLKNYTLGY